MKDYYKILGIEEEASGEEMEARWAELTMPCASDQEGAGETDERMKEINEAYQVLKNPSARTEYDLERLLKRSIRNQIDQRREKRSEKKRIILPTGLVVLLLIVGFFIFIMPQLIAQQKRAAVPPEPVFEAKRLIRVSGSGSNQKGPQPVPEEVAKIDKTIPPTPEPLKKEPGSQEEIRIEAAKTEKPALEKIIKVDVSTSPGPLSGEIANVQEPKPAPQQPPFAATQIKQSEVAGMTEKETPKEGSTIWAIPEESPVSQTTDRKTQGAQMPPAKPATPIPAGLATPSPIATEKEVRQFLVKYVDRYAKRDVEGFLSFFSPRAIQNQKDGIEGIREIYSRQFDRNERLKYQLKNVKIEILEGIATAKASYEIEQFPRKGEVKRLQGNIEWHLVREEGDLKILTLHYRHEKSQSP